MTAIPMAGTVSARTNVFSIAALVLVTAALYAVPRSWRARTRST